MYYILKFSETWSLFDQQKNQSRQLEKSEIEALRQLFPAILADNNKVLQAIQVNAVQPNKLVNTPIPTNTAVGKKPADQSKHPPAVAQ